MKREHILKEIKRIAAANGGRAPGAQRFQTETGIRKSDWYPMLWLRWSDAIREAGCQINVLSQPYGGDVLIKKYIDLIRELKRFPIEGDLRIKRQKDRTFPGHCAFSRLGSKAERVRKIHEYCLQHSGYDDVIPCCKGVKGKQSLPPEETHSTKSPVGYVYLVKHGSRREYKIGRTNNPLRREGEISIQLPEQLKPEHYIETEIPSDGGIPSDGANREK